MRLWKAVVVTLAFVSMDVGVTTAIYAFSHLDRSLLEDIRHFNIFDSVLDLWAACLYRSCLLLGATIGVAKNSTLGPRRLRASWLVITLVCLFVGIYAMAKLLLFSEVRRPIRDPWFWALFVWTYISLAASFLLWGLLATVRPDAEALEPGNEGFHGEGGAPAEQASGATLQKLLSYTKPDVAFLVAASFFLIMAALAPKQCKARSFHWVPWYLDCTEVWASSELQSPPLWREVISTNSKNKNTKPVRTPGDIWDLEEIKEQMSEVRCVLGRGVSCAQVLRQEEPGC